MQAQLHLFTENGLGVLSYSRYMFRTSESDDLKARLARMRRLLDALEKACSERDRQRDVMNRLLREMGTAYYPEFRSSPQAARSSPLSRDPRGPAHATSSACVLVPGEPTRVEADLGLAPAGPHRFVCCRGVRVAAQPPRNPRNNRNAKELCNRSPRSLASVSPGCKRVIRPTCCESLLDSAVVYTHCTASVCPARNTGDAHRC